MGKPHILILIICLVALTACSKSAATPAPIVQAPTLAPTTAPTAAPTATPRPTDTPPPTATIPPTATPVPLTATPTRTPAPTATPSPSPTPAPAASVTGDSVNVRAGPGTVYPVVAQASRGNSLPVLARNEDGSWLEVELASGEVGWVAAELVSLSESIDSLPIAATPQDGEFGVLEGPVGGLLNLRMNTSGQAKGEGQRSFPAGTSKVWCAFEVDLETFQIGDAYSVEIIGPSGTSLVVVPLIGPKVIYKGTSLGFDSQAHLRYFAVPVEAPGGSFPAGDYRSLFLLNGQVMGALDWSVGIPVHESHQAPRATVTTAPTSTLTATPSPTRRTTNTPRPTATPTAQHQATPTAASAGGATTVKSSRLNLRSGPGTSFSIEDTLRRGDELGVLGQFDDCAWLQVKTTQGKEGWVSGNAQYVTLNVDCEDVPAASYRPRSGVIRDKVTRAGLGELTVENGSGSDGVVVLATLNDQTVMAAYVRESETATMTGIPDGTYRLYYAKGKNWDPDEKKFTENVSRQRFEDTFTFETSGFQYTTWQVTLYPVVGGTAKSEDVNSEDFPSLD